MSAYMTVFAALAMVTAVVYRIVGKEYGDG